MEALLSFDDSSPFLVPLSYTVYLQSIPFVHGVVYNYKLYSLHSRYKQTSDVEAEDLKV